MFKVNMILICLYPLVLKTFNSFKFVVYNIHVSQLKTCADLTSKQCFKKKEKKKRYLIFLET